MKNSRDSLRIPGLSLAIIKNGKVIRRGGYGWANLELQVPATSKTVYEIGSISKSFTAMAIAILMERGRLKPDDKINSFFPCAPAYWNHITIRHLLTHTSGIQNHVAVPGYLGKFTTSLLGENFPSPDDILKMFCKLPQEFLPGETWSYDNTGYYLLGLIIEKISGKSYWTFMDQEIFSPLGMKSTRSTDTRSLVSNRASGYVWKDSAFQNQPVLWPFVAFSAGSILSTVEDMALWDLALYSERLVKRSSLEQMWKPVMGNNGEPLPCNYGFGWFTDLYHGHRIVQHSGGTPGFSSSFFRFPNDSFSVIILTNHADQVIDQIAIDLAGIYIPSLKRPLAITDPQPSKTDRRKNIFIQLLQGKHDAIEFTPAMNTFLKTSTGKSLFQWFASLGEPGSFRLSDIEKRKGYTVFRYRVQLGRNIYLFTISEMDNGKIAQIYFS